MPKPPQNLREFTSLLQVVEALRGPEGCPWDKEQTHRTLTRYAIEEAFELSEAIDGGNDQEICDELGDLLLQVILHAEIARQEGRFDIYSVMENLNAKMVRRHPHVFGSTTAKTSAEVLTNWAQIKAEEKAGQAKTQQKKAQSRPLSFDIPQGLPALLRAQKIGEKTAKTQFDWTDAHSCWEKVAEEFGELKEALDAGQPAAISHELGDLLFSLAQIARHLKMDSEQSLRETNTRFERRYLRMQELVREDGQQWENLSAELKESYWTRAKADS